jgi:hypothetical protein
MLAYGRSLMTDPFLTSIMQILRTLFSKVQLTSNVLSSDSKEYVSINSVALRGGGANGGLNVTLYFEISRGSTFSMKTRPFFWDTETGGSGGGAGEKITNNAIEMISKIAVMKRAISFLLTTPTGKNTSFLCD